MVDVGHECLHAVLDEEAVRKVARYLKGCRVSFPRTGIEHDEICTAYAEMTERGAVHSEAVKQLSMRFERSESQIRRIIKRCGDR